MKAIDCDVLILGGGLAGLSAASALGERAIVLERSERPGGLVKTERFGDYWFDHVIHVLYFPDAETESRTTALFSGELQALRLNVKVETLAGTTRYPFQMHLGDLDRRTAVSCIYDLAEVTFCPQKAEPENFEEHLLRTFGKSMCDIFLFPYNRKVWKRPLNALAAKGGTWTITQPDFDQVLLGALAPDAGFEVYNSHGYCPRGEFSRVRGMELLSRRLASKVVDLRLGHDVQAIDLERQLVHVRHHDEEILFHYRSSCCSTLPLPITVSSCMQASAMLKERCKLLRSSRVISVALAIKGQRPEECGHWRYYADEGLSFTRLVYMHEFDPGMAPRDGWGLLVEITEPPEWMPNRLAAYIQRVKSDLLRIGAIPGGCEILHETATVVEPAYVVFDLNREAIVRDAIEFLRNNHLEPLGRYGCWEYSSMGQVIRDGFSLGSRI